MMRHLVFFIVTFLLLATAASAAPLAIVETNLGTFRIELDAEKAPVTVDNFVKYANAGFFDGTVFHRVIEKFMIQGGGYDTDLNKKPTRPAIANEADNGLTNDRGTVAMARTNIVDSATSQFFVSLKDNTFLNHTSKSSSGYGYAVFGKVVEGMDVVDKIGTTETRSLGPQFRDIPVETVIIQKVTIE